MYIGGASSVEFNQVEFFDNVATYGAAAAVTGASSAKFDGCSMFNHNSGNYGTILASDASFIVFRGDLNHMIAGFPSGLVADNRAVSAAGFRIIDNSIAVIEDAVLRGNTASFFGGGITLQSGSRLAMSRVTIVENIAEGGFGSDTRGGGGIYVTSGSTLTCDKCTLIENSAVPSGGALTIDGGATATFRNSHFRGNGASEGAAIFLMDTGPSLTVENSSFSDHESGTFMIHDITGDDHALVLDTTSFDGNALPAIYSTGSFVAQNCAGLDARDVLNATVAECVDTQEFCMLDACTDATTGTDCYCLLDGSTPTNDLLPVGCMESGTLSVEVPSKRQITLLATKNDEITQELVIANTGGESINWELTAGGIDLRVTPNASALGASALQILTVTFASAGMHARADPYLGNITLTAVQGSCVCKQTRFSIDVRALVSADVSAHLSTVTVSNPTGLVAASPATPSQLELSVTPRDLAGMRIFDSADVAFFGFLTHAETGTRVTCDLRYDTTLETHAGTCTLPELMIGIFILNVTSGRDDMLVGGSSRSFDVDACPATFIKDGEKGCTCGPGATLAAGECVSCDYGKAKDAHGVDSCTPCDAERGYTSNSDRTACSVCLPDNYWDGAACSKCPNGARCDKPGTTTASMRVLPGWWRSNEQCMPLLCPLEHLCLGTSTNDTIPCKEGSEGAYCAVCESGYYATFQGCEACVEYEYFGALVIIIGLAGLVTYRCSAWIKTYQGGDEEEANENTEEEANENTAASGQGKHRGRRRRSRIKYTSAHKDEKRYRSYASMLIGFGQITASIGPVYNINWASSFSRAIGWLGSIVNLNVFSLLPLTCAFSSNFHTKERLYLLGYPAVRATGAAIYAYLSRKPGRRAKARAEMLTYGLFFFSVFFYMPVATTTFQAFRCEEFEDGQRLLSADYSIDCESAEHERHRLLAFASVVLIVIGQPLAQLIVLVRGNRAKARGARDGLLVMTFDVLSSDFRAEAFFTHPIVCLQKTTTAGLLVLFEPSFIQAITGLLISIFWCTTISRLDPFPTKPENRVEVVLNLATCIVMVGAVTSKLDAVGIMTGELAREYRNCLLWASLIAAISAPVVGVLGECVFGVLGECDFPCIGQRTSTPEEADSAANSEADSEADRVQAAPDPVIEPTERAEPDDQGGAEHKTEDPPPPEPQILCADVALLC